MATTREPHEAIFWHPPGTRKLPQPCEPVTSRSCFRVHWVTGVRTCVPTAHALYKDTRTRTLRRLHRDVTCHVMGIPSPDGAIPTVEDTCTD